MIEKKSSFEIRISLKICYVSLKIYSFGGFDEIREECGWFQDSRSGILVQKAHVCVFVVCVCVREGGRRRMECVCDKDTKCVCVCARGITVK